MRDEIYYLDSHDLETLESIAAHLCAGSDKMRDQGNRLWLVIWRI